MYVLGWNTYFESAQVSLDGFSEEGKRFKFQIHIIIINKPTGSNMACVVLLPQAKLEFEEDASIRPKYCQICCI